MSLWGIVSCFLMDVRIRYQIVAEIPECRAVDVILSSPWKVLLGVQLKYNVEVLVCTPGQVRFENRGT